MVSMQQRGAQIFGAVFVLVAILGFFSPLIFGLFQVDLIHNIVHLASGLFLLWAGFTSHSAAVTSLRTVGVVYAIVTVLGFVALDAVNKLMAMNATDNYLHLLLALVLLGLGFSAMTATNTARRA